MAAVGSLKTSSARNLPLTSNLEGEHKEVIGVSDSPPAESGDDSEELVYDTTCVGRKTKTRTYRYQRAKVDWTLTDNSDNGENENNTLENTAPVMDQLAATLAQLAQSQADSTAQLAQSQADSAARLAQSQADNAAQLAWMEARMEEHQERRMVQQEQLLAQLARRTGQRKDVMAHWKDTNDIEAYLGTFECATTREDKDPEEWTQELVPLLSGSALTVYNGLDANVDFYTLKEALLTHFGVTVMGSKL